MQEVFVKAVREGAAEVVRALLADPRVDPAADDNRAIRAAASFDHAEVVRALLADQRVDPTANNNDAIQSVSYYGHVDVARVLLSDPRVDPAANNNYAIRWASRFGYSEVVQLLLSHARVDPRVAIEGTAKCARLIASDARGGVEQNYDLFQRFHPEIAREYQARLRQCYAVAWVATQECGWIDVVEPVVKRLKVAF